MIERLTEIIRIKKLNASKFADEIGVQRSNVSHVLSGRNKPSLEFVLKILEKYPDITADWLLYGKEKTGFENENLFGKENIGNQKELFNTSEPKSQIDESAINEHNIIQKTVLKGQNKIVEKIIVFYSDNSYEEFSPKH